MTKESIIKTKNRPKREKRTKPKAVIKEVRIKNKNASKRGI
jgi:hypothetical protein